ncbi:hypothetical protein [Methylocystis parvus]|uniref:hypothetical protein n=1 Tax=Methylocystis parvus TaxID=134 RepID=UPI003C708009
MRKRLLASLIVCVALLTQIGASLWGAAAAREGYAPCHRSAVALADGVASGVAGGQSLPTGAPVSHDHGSCSLCQLGLTVIGGEAPVLPVRAVAHAWRVPADWVEAHPPGFAYNKSAPPRAPPFLA